MPLRAWFHDAQGVYLAQLQFDRLILNWRKQANAGYPTYDVMQPKFIALWEVFLKFLQGEGLDAPTVRACEVTYVNHITAADAATVVGQGGDLYTFWRGGPTDFIRESFTQSFEIALGFPNRSDRLVVRMVPVRDVTNAEAIQQLQFSSTSQSQSNAPEAVLAALDTAHSLGIRGFLEFISEDLQRFWGRKEAP
jgi:uncharacterized protein (TIGR04255 family)